MNDSKTEMVESFGVSFLSRIRDRRKTGEMFQSKRGNTAALGGITMDDSKTEMVESFGVSFLSRIRDRRKTGEMFQSKRGSTAALGGIAMNDSKTEMVGSFGVSFLSGTRNRRKTTSALSFSLVQRLLLAGALLVGLALAAPAWAQNLVLSATELTINEGGTATFTVKLAAQPGNNRRVNLSSTIFDVRVDPDLYTVSNQHKLIFTAANWNVEQTVTVTVIHDLNNTHETATISLTGTGITAGAVTVNVVDDDDFDSRLTLSPTSLTVEGDNTKTFKVKLTVQPGKDRTVNLSSNNSDVTVDVDPDTTGNQTTLTFTAANWNVEQTVTVAVAHDTDKTDGTATISLTGTKITAGAVTVNYVAVGLTLSPTSLTIEGASTKTFKVKLTAQPRKDRTVNLSSNNSDVTVDVDPDTTGNQTTLTFTAANWNVEQTVTVAVAHDTDKTDGTATISLTGTKITAGAVTVNYVAVGLTLSPTSLTIEGANTKTFKVKLTAQPRKDRTVNLSSNNSDVTVDVDPDTTGNQTTLTFTAANWNAEQTVTVAVAQDSAKTDGTAKISLAGTGITAGAVTVNYVAVGLTLSPTSLTIEEGNTKTFKVKLTGQPRKDRTVNLSSNNSDVTVDVDPDTTGNQTTLTFTAENWNAEQTVTVAAAHDTDKTDDTAKISLTGTGITAGTVTVNVADDEAVGLTLSVTELKMNEGSTATFTVKLAEQFGDRTLTLQSSNSDVIVDTDPSTKGNQAALTFAAAEWNTAKTVTLTAAEDDDGADDSATISLTGDRITTVPLKVTVTDNDRELILSETLLRLTEGESGSFRVKLSHQPPKNVTVTLTQPGNTDVTVDTDTIKAGNQNTLLFTKLNWSSYQTVQVSAAADLDTDNERASILLTAVGEGFVTKTGTVTVKVKDSPFLVSTDKLTLVEGTSVTFTVQLGTPPSQGFFVTEDFDLWLNPAFTFDADPDTPGNQTNLPFTSSNWSTPQTVTVRAAHDTNRTDESGILYVLTLDQSSIKELRVLVLDDDIGMTLSATSLVMDEGSSKTFTVQLAHQPGNERTITLSSTNSDITFSPAKLSFSASNVAQTVTLRAANDPNKTDDTATINLRGAGVTSASLPVTVIDDDDSAVGLTLSKSTLTVIEGASGTFTVQLAKQPANGRTVSLASNNSEVTLDSTKLIFTTSNWNVAQTVTVRGAQDSDKTDDSTTISLTGDRITAGSLAVTVMDDDDSAVGLTASPTSLELVEEGASGTFELRLAAKPANNRSIALSVTGDLTVSPATLSFIGGDSGNWNTGQTVTVSATGDADKNDETATVNWAGDPAIENLAGISRITAGSLPVSITDNDDTAVGLTLSPAPPASLTVVEGASGTFTVKLAAKPAKGRTVSLAVSGSPDVTVDTDATKDGNQNTLTFTTANWNTAQTVTVRAAEDADGADDTANISLTGDRITTASLAVTVTDNDRGLSVSTTALTVPENDSRTFTVALATQPSDTVTVTLAQPTDNPNADITVADTDTGTAGTQNTLTFTTANWNTAQTVTVKAADDADALRDTATINLSASGGDYTDETATVTVTVTENDTAGLAIVQATDPLAVIEGSSATFTVALATQPSAEVTVTLAQPANTDVTVDTKTGTDGNQNTLTFTTSNWNTAKMVTVKAAEDADGSDDSATISLTADGGDYGSVTGSVSVRVTDNDRGVTVSKASLTIVEGSSDTFTVKLAAQPGSNVTVTLAQPTDSINADVTFDTDPDAANNQSTLTFTTSTWNTAQRVTVRAAEDADGIDDSATINVSATGDGYGVANKVDVSVGVTDNDRGLTVSATSLTMTEGSSGSFKVKLAAAPSADVTVNITQPNNPNSDVTTTPTSLTFTTGNWGTEQTVTVNAADDADGINDSATLQLEATGGGYTSETANVTVNVTDNDTPGLTVSKTSMTITEGSSDTFTVELGTQPSASVTVTIAQTGTSNADITVADTDTGTAGNQNTLTFTTGNWDTEQTVTVNAANDGDGDEDRATLRVSATGGGYDDVPHKDVSVTVTDGDHGLEVTKSSLTIIEGRSKSFKVRLAEDPGSAQTVTLTSDNPDVAVDTDLTVLGFQNTLTFDSSKKWDQNQTVRVYAIHDTDADKADIAATITLADTGVVTETVSVTVLDDDIRLISSPSSLTILEGGSKTFTVRPDSDTYPGNERIINLTRSTGSSDVTFDTNPDKPGNQTQLTFTTNNWTTAQEVTVRAATDADKIDDSATIKLKGDGVKTSYVRVTVLDDDIGLTLVPTSLTVDEGGTHQTFEVKLDTQPRYDRTISLTLSSGLSLAGVTVDTNTGKTGNQTTMTFKLGKWDTNRVVTVKAAHDSNKVDETGTITLSGDGIDSGTVTVNVNDDDKIGLTLSKTSLTIEEGGFRTFTVRPAAQLDTTRTVTLSSTNSKVTIDDTDPDTAGNQTALEFTTSNWRTAQTVKISAAVDDSDKTDETATIKLTGGGFVAKSVDVEVIDDDIGLTLSPTSLTVNEGGSATFTVALADRPTNARSVHLSSDNGVTVDVDPDMSGNQAALTFAPNKWSNARTVTVRAGHDLDGSNGSETISLSVKRGGMTLATVSLPVTVNDDDRGLIVSSTDLTVAENGSGTFTVKLAAKPKSNVTVTLAQPDDDDDTQANADVTFDTDTSTDGNQNTLTFSTDNWNTAQTVTVKAADDPDAIQDRAKIKLTATGGDYTTETAIVTVTVTENDTAGFIFASTPVTLTEGATADFTVALTSQPSANVTVTLAQPTNDANDDVTFDTDTGTAGNQDELTFTTANWKTAQTVTVKAAEDADAVEDRATIRVSAEGGGYDDVDNVDVSVTVTETDTAGITVSTSTLTIDENASGTFTVKLNTEPSASVTVEITQSNIAPAKANADVTVDTDTADGNQNTLTFTTTNWKTAQTVTVNAAEDDDGINDSATLQLSAKGGDYGSVTGSVGVTVNDDDTPALTVSETSLRINENSSGTFTVKLDTEPSASVTVSIDQPVPANTDVTVDTNTSTAENENTLTFTTANWKTAQTVTVSAKNDDDGSNGEATLRISARNGGYDSVSHEEVSVTVTDDDRGLTVSKTSLTIDEGSSDTFTVKLAAKPGSDVTVTLAQPTDNTDVTVDTDTGTANNQNTLTFTKENWETAQTVTVNTVDDEDGIQEENATINLSAAGGDYTTETATVTVTVTENDTAGLTVSTSTLTIDENASGTFTVKLNTEPSGSVTVEIAQSNIAPAKANADVTVDTDTDTAGNQNTLTFTTTNWDSAQTVTVNAAEDDDGDDDSATLQLKASGGDYGSVTGSVGVTVTDNDTLGLTVSKSTLTIDEGSSGTFTVKLAKQPNEDVTVELGGTTGSDLILSKTSLTFSTTNWNTAQPVTVTAGNDADKTNDTATIKLTGSGISASSVTVNVTDDDDVDVEVEFSVEDLEINEGDTATLGVRLAAQPGKDRTAIVLTDDISVLKVKDTDSKTEGYQTTPLTFTAANWDTFQTVTVAAPDNDSKGDKTVRLVLYGTGIITDLSSGKSTLNVTVIDDDDVDVGFKFQSPVTELAITELTVNEGGTATFKVRLDDSIGKPRDVTLSSNNSDVTVDTSTLNFSTGGWNKFQTVTVVAAHDDNKTDNTVTISLKGDGVTNSSITVNVIDDDVGLVLSASSLMMDEGGAAETFNVKLDAWPGNPRTVTLSSDNSDVTVDTDASKAGNQTKLTFEAANWDINRRVTVSAVKDDDGISDSATISFEVSRGKDYEGKIASVSVSVTVNDNDTAALVIVQDADPLAVTEESTATFTVKLATQPSDDVTVTLEQPANTDVTVDINTSTAEKETTLTFTNLNWNTAQEVTVTAGDDDDGSDDTATISLTASGADYGDVSGSVVVNVTDNDTPALVIVPGTGPLAVTEESNASFTVALKTQPSENVTVTLGGTTGTDLTLSPTSLTFTSSTWNTAQPVTVNAGDDDDGSDDTATITLTAKGADYGKVTGSLVVNVSDNDTAGLVIGQATDPLAVTEGGSATFTVKLATKPSENVTVTLGGTTDTDLTLSTASLTFTSSTWNTAQEVTVTAGDDDDRNDDRATIAMDPAGGVYDDVDDVDIEVEVKDNDTPALIFSSDSITVEEGSSTTFTVRLRVQPSDTVTVTLVQPSNTDVTVDTGTKTPEGQSTLTFTTANWNTAQTVKVSAAEDDEDRNDERAAINVSASGGDYNFVRGSVAVDVEDNDAPALIFSSDSITVDEGSSTNFTVRLRVQPSDPVMVTLGQPDGEANTDVTFDTDSDTNGNQNTLEFTTSNWETAQTVTVSAKEDDDGIQDKATITMSASGGDYSSVSGSIEVTVTENDTPGILVSKNSLTITEGSSDTFMVKLATQPSEDVTVSIAQTGTNNSNVTATPASLTFTASNWKTDQTVTVNAAEDNEDEVDETATLRVSASGGDYGSVAHKDVSVKVDDNDKPGITLSSDSVTLTEGLNTTFTVKLDAEPSGDVTVSITQPDDPNADVTVDTKTDEDGNQNTLTFTTLNWQTAQTVTVNAAEDIDLTDDTATLRVGATGGGYGSVTGSVGVTVKDNDLLGLEVSKASLTISEGASDSFTVKPEIRTSGNVTVTLVQPSNTDVTVTPASLIFTTENWEMAQTVTVNTKKDDDAIKDTATITMSASAGGYGTVTGSIGVTVNDSDTPGLTFDPTSVTLTEGSNTTFTVKLATKPSTSVTVRLVQPADNTDVTVDTDTETVGNQTELTFTTSNWQTAQTVTVSAADDEDRNNDTATITMSASGGDYNAVPGSIEVTVNDNDVPGLTVSATSLTIREGASGSFTVKLNTQPTGNVTVSIAQPNDPNPNSDVTTNPTSLTFTTENWNAAQTVTVNAAEDYEGGDDTATLQVSATGGGYGSVERKNVSVNVEDNGTPGLTLSATELTVDEGSSTTFTVKLNSRPSASVTVTLGQPDDSTDSDVTLDESSLTFTAENWGTVQTVTVSAKEDGDRDNDTATINVTSRGGVYDDVDDVDITVNVQDNGLSGLILSATKLTVDEDSSGTFTVKLAAQPSESVTVTLVQPTDNTNSDVTLDKSSLTFTTSNWSTEQTVTVRAARDADNTDDTATINLTGTGIIDGSVKVTVTDDGDGDVRLILSGTSRTVNEGDTLNLGFYLGDRPGNDRNITLTSDNSDVTLKPEKLTFTPDNWDIVQTVTVIAAEEGYIDYTDETVTITIEGSRIAEIPVRERTIWVNDNDAENTIILDKTWLGLDAGANVGKSETRGTFTVRLSSQPSADRTVNVGSDDPNITVAPTSLTFTPSNWDDPQTVRVGASRNAERNNYDAFIKIPNPEDPDLSGRLLVVSVQDPKFIGATLSSTTLSVDEGSSGSFTVRVNSAPKASRTVRLDVSNGENGRVTLDKNVLTFTPFNWNIPQKVTVNATQDADAKNGTATIRPQFRVINSAGAYGWVNASSSPLTVTVLDDEIKLKITPLELTVNEGGSGRFEVSLKEAPSSAIKVSVAPQSASDVTVDQTELTFTAENWSSAQPVTVRAAEDADTTDDTATITLTPEDSSMPPDSVTVTVTDNDDGDVGLNLSETSPTMNEGGTLNLGLYLGARPGNDRIITLTSNKPKIITLSPAKLTFTPDNWGIVQTVTATAAADDDHDDETVTITIKGSRIANAPVEKTIWVNDSDAKNTIILNKTWLGLDAGADVGKSETPGTFTVRLSSRPSANRTVNVGSDDPNITVAPTSLTFIRDKWHIPQTVKVGASRDAEKKNYDAVIQIPHPEDPDLHGRSLVVSVQDPKFIGATLSSTTLSVGEGSSGSFTVRVNSAPKASRTVRLDVSDGEDARVTLDKNVLTFTPFNWNIPQKVTVNATQDDNAENGTATIRPQFRVINSDGDYGWVNASSTPLTVTVLDDEIKLDITPLELTVNEGGSDSFDVRLKKAPSSAITVNVSLPSGSDVTVDKTALTFNASNWNVSQTVTVSAGPDDDSENDNVTIALSGTGVGSASVKVTVIDDDTAGLSLSGVLRKLDGDGAGRLAVALAAHSGNKPTNGLQILSHSDAMPDADRVAGGSLGSLAFNMVKVSFADACPAGALPSVISPPARECSSAILAARRFSPGAGKAGTSP